MAIDLKYGQVEIPGIPVEEPVFIIRAKDDIAVDSIEEYFNIYRAIAPDSKSYDAAKADAFLRKGSTVISFFEGWRQENEDVVRMPD